MDIIFANGNEDKFIEIAKKLSTPKILFVGSSSKDVEFKGSLLGSKSKIGAVDIVLAYNPSRENFGKGIDIAFGFEEQKRSDFLHHRNSGLNQILVSILKEKDIIVAFSFSSALNDRHGTVLGRMKQNVRLCRKAKVPMVVASFASRPYELRSLNDLKSFASAIGMTASEIKRSFLILEERIVRNRKKRKGLIIADGAEIVG
jgi:hypothetical protein